MQSVVIIDRLTSLQIVITGKIIFLQYFVPNKNYLAVMTMFNY